LAGILMPEDLPSVVESSTPLSPSVHNATDGSITADPEMVAYYMRQIVARTEARRQVAAAEFSVSFRPPAVRSLEEELAMPDEPVLWTVGEVMPFGANVLLTAQYKTGKTTLAGNLIAALADGKPFLGRFDVEPVEHRVALLNYEMGEAMMRRWLRDLGIVHTERVYVVNLRGMSLPLTDGLAYEWIANRLKDSGVTTLIIDPHARAIGGLDENSNADMTIFTNRLDDLKAEVGIREIVLVSHTGRMQHDIGAERTRGATRLDDWPDVRWLIVKDSEDVRYFRAIGRDVEMAEQPLHWDPVMRMLTLGDSGGRTRRDGFGSGTLPTFGSQGALCDAIVRSVAANPGTSAGAVQEWIKAVMGTGVRKQAVLDGVRSLLSQGVLHNTSDTKVYRLYLPKDRP
jgi:hypothetical protein